MKRYFNGYIALFGGLCGLISYSFARLFLDARLAATSALLFALGLILFLPYVLYSLVRRSEKRYAGFDAMFADSLVLKINANCYIGKRVRNGWLYALPDQLCIAVCDKKPYKLIKLSYANIQTINVESKTTFVVVCRDNRKIQFVSKNAERMVRYLRFAIYRMAHGTS